MKDTSGSFCHYNSYSKFTQPDAQNTIDSLQEECYICYRLNG